MTRRKIEVSSAFKRDFKKIKNSGTAALKDFEEVLNFLAVDATLPERMRDHALTDCKEFTACRELHLCPDVLLVYRKPSDGILQLVRLGSHAELFR